MANWDIVILPHFKRALKPLVKKHRDIFDAVIFGLKQFDPNLAIKIRENVYKLRLSTKSLKRGKSGGYRLFTLALEIDKRLVPITIYSKSTKENLTETELETHIQIILTELTES